MQARAFQEHQEYILPARFDDTPIPGVLPTVGYISLAHKTPQAFVNIVKKKLIYSGRTIPSESIRRSLFATTIYPRVDPVLSRVRVVSSDDTPIQGATVVAIADNSTTKTSSSSLEGVAEIAIPTRRLYQLLVAHQTFPGAVIRSWDPIDDVSVTLFITESTGSVICETTGYIPGLEGRLNPILDTSNRMYLYADNIAINGGQHQPATLQLNVPIELEDSNGVVMQVRVLHIQGRTSLLEYVRPTYGDF
jgi:hypothetical protein